MTITALLDLALPYSAEDNRCGMKRKVKSERRIQLAYKLNDIRKGKAVTISGDELMIDYATFERKLQQWILSLKRS